MGKDLEFSRYLRGQNLMDLDSRDGKRGGGYCTLLTKYGLPYIFMIFNGRWGCSCVYIFKCEYAFQAFA